MEFEGMKNRKSLLVIIVIVIAIIVLFDDVRLRLKIKPVQQSYSALQKKCQDETMSLLAQNKLLVGQISSLLSEKTRVASQKKTQPKRYKAHRTPGIKK